MTGDWRYNSCGKAGALMPATLDMIAETLGGRGVLEVVALQDDGGGGVRVYARDGSGLEALIPGAGDMGTVAWLMGRGLSAVVTGRTPLQPVGLVKSVHAPELPPKLSRKAQEAQRVGQGDLFG